ncbi:unnamed protein product [Orchesella dallaii]|uniref:Uncharacterized protein n=1 Tax=Orchesella dallaii TaxID=48710 RepID=A0ABP1QR17_9HEXA
MKVLLISLLFIVLVCVNAEPSGWGGFFQYANVPGWGQYEFGYNRGNHDHFTSRFEQGWGWKFKTKVRWGDKKGGYGESYYDYQHAPKKGWGHQTHGKHHAAYSENVPTVLRPGNQGIGNNPQLIGPGGPQRVGRIARPIGIPAY